jgi:hypothetical protein
MTSSQGSAGSATARGRIGAVGLEEPWQAPDDALLLLCADSGIERKLLEQWSTGQVRTRDGAAVPTVDVGLGPDPLAVRLQEHGRRAGGAGASRGRRAGSGAADCPSDWRAWCDPGAGLPAGRSRPPCRRQTS